MQPFERAEHDKEELGRLSGALQELNNTSPQILIFLSFAIVAGVTLLTGMVEPANKSGGEFVAPLVDRRNFPHGVRHRPAKGNKGRKYRLVSLGAEDEVRLVLVSDSLHLGRRDSIPASYLVVLEALPSD